MGKHRRRLKQSDSLEQRFAAAAKLLREEAAILPPGFDRDTLLRKACQAETMARHISGWLRSPGLQPPE